MQEFCVEIALHTARYNLTTFRETYSDKFCIVFFVYCNISFCCKDRRLYFYMNEIRDQNVNIPMDSKRKNYALNTHCTLLDSI